MKEYYGYSLQKTVIINEIVKEEITICKPSNQK